MEKNNKPFASNRPSVDVTVKSRLVIKKRSLSFCCRLFIKKQAAGADIHLFTILPSSTLQEELLQ